MISTDKFLSENFPFWDGTPAKSFIRSKFKRSRRCHRYRSLITGPQHTRRGSRPMHRKYGTAARCFAPWRPPAGPARPGSVWPGPERLALLATAAARLGLGCFSQPLAGPPQHLPRWFLLKSWPGPERQSHPGNTGKCRDINPFRLETTKTRIHEKIS